MSRHNPDWSPLCIVFRKISRNFSYVQRIGHKGSSYNLYIDRNSSNYSSISPTLIITSCKIKSNNWLSCFQFYINLWINKKCLYLHFRLVFGCFLMDSPQGRQLLLAYINLRRFQKFIHSADKIELIWKYFSWLSCRFLDHFATIKVLVNYIYII